MIFNDYFIVGQDSARDFLYSLGMDKFDVEEFTQLLCSEYEDDKRYWMAEAQEWQADAEREFEMRNSLITALWLIVDDLLEGKSTKRKLADQISNLCEFYS